MIIAHEASDHQEKRWHMYEKQMDFRKSDRP